MYYGYIINMKLTRTIKLRLKLKSEDILPTVKAATQAFNYVCQVGHKDKDYNSISLHHKTYKYVRDTFKLPADTTTQMRMKAAEVLKPAIKQKVKCPESKLCSIRYSHQGYNVWFNKQELTLLTLTGRIRVSFYFPKQFEQYLSWRRKSAELIIRKDKVYLCVIFQKDIEDSQKLENPIILGIDRGINKVAVCSDNTFYNGNVLRVTNKYQKLRNALQKCGTPSAKRHLQRISLKENRFKKDVNHCISKKIVKSLPENSIIVFEDLKKIRQRARLNKKGRKKLHSWSFYQLENFVTYKANANKISIDYVDARYTSQKCSKCFYVSRSNRKYQSVFKCKKCGFSLNADLNASRNIETNYRDANGYPERLSVNQPIVRNEVTEVVTA